ncbi:amino acid ABC transporter permease [Nocardioides antri]|uniref:Amino acid ABC transporter permease n=1 Tax=Nocardioides antri TaxID=2607659 RepID=A0A5B1LZG8_9ACTN|nr:amino acid ABC transporter permease [Nocardioides antri]KAA1425836.1 amino acid ABC transporter permease [Nocardioides antri]
MAGSVLFDAPGPRTIARHRIYSVLSVLALAGLAALVVLKLEEKGQFEYALWEPFLTPEYIEALLVDGLLNTLLMAFGAILGAVVFGVLFGVGKLSDHPWVRWPCWLVVEFWRAVPVLLSMIFWWMLLSLGDGPLSPLQCVIIALTLYNGAVLAEAFRAGILAVPVGQVEAAYALGMRKTQVMTTIQLPQAVKIMLPVLVSQCIVALKDTSLGYAIGAPGLTYIGEQIYIEFRVNQVPTAIVLAAAYIAVNLLLTLLANWLQKRYVGEKKVLEVPMVGEAHVTQRT